MKKQYSTVDNILCSYNYINDDYAKIYIIFDEEVNKISNGTFLLREIRITMTLLFGKYIQKPNEKII